MLLWVAWRFGEDGCMVGRLFENERGTVYEPRGNVVRLEGYG